MILENIADFLNKVGKDGSLLALDVGEKNIGVAACDIMQMIALPIEVYRRTNIRQDLGYIRRIVKERAIIGIIIGLPISLDNTEKDNCANIRKFAGKVYDKVVRPILLIDERMSTAAVTRLMQENDVKRKKRHENDDKLAASYLLQIVLDSQI